MLIIYDSRTGNVERFVRKLNMNKIKKVESDLIVNEEYILLTFTTGFGQVPETTLKFLQNNHKYLRAVVVSGNKNWGSYYGNAGEIISREYDVPLLMKFELSGTQNDVEMFKREVETFGKMD